MKTTKRLAFAGMIGALYVVLTVAQNLLLPGSASQAIQFRVSEALMMCTLFFPESIWGLTIGCAVSNITSGGMPADIVIGSIATLLAGLGIYYTRKVRIKGFPVLSLIFPAVSNGIIIGAEIAFYSGVFTWSTFLINGACVAIGELGVSIVIGIPFYYLLNTRMKNLGESL